MKAVNVEARDLVGRYRLIGPIGSGVTGAVWLAKAPRDGQEVALRLLSEAAVSSRFFQNRWQQLRDLSARRPAHPAVAEILDLGEHGPQRYVVSELVRAESLADRLRRQPRLTAEEVMGIATRVAEGLEWAHRAGVAHGAVRPANVFLADQGVVKVTDFAINQGLFADRADVDTSVDLAVCSPEQLAGLGTSPASDVYSLGVLLYQMLSEETPFRGDNPHELARRTIRDRPPSLSGMGVELPDQVLHVCKVSLAKDAHARPSAGMFASLLRQAGGGEPVLTGGTAASPDTEPTSTRMAAPPVLAGELAEVTVEKAGRGPRPVRRRSPDFRQIGKGTLGALILTGILAAALVITGDWGTGGSPTQAPPPSVSHDARVEVPNLVGLSASKARRQLLTIGLKVEKLVPVAGTPGMVVRTQPPAGAAVTRGTRITLFVGVEKGRLQTEREQSPSPG